MSAEGVVLERSATAPCPVWDADRKLTACVGLNALCLCRTAIKAVCSEYKCHNADIHMKEDCEIDDLVDVIEGSRVYIPAIYAVNKIDQITVEELNVRC